AGSDFLIDPVAFAYDFGARMYDARLGRWLSVDPLAAKYPNLSPYNFVGNSPILYVDYDGRDYGVYINHKTQTIVIKANIYTTKAYSRESNSASMNISCFIIVLFYFIFGTFDLKGSFDSAILWNFWRVLFYGIPFIILY